MLEFIHPETASRFECLVEADRTVHKAGLYSGLLSNITPAMAEAFVSGGTNLVKVKETSEPKDPEPADPDTTNANHAE